MTQPFPPPHAHAAHHAHGHGHGHSHSHSHGHGHGPAHPPQSVNRGIGPEFSLIRLSVMQRLALTLGPIFLLWLLLGWALAQ